MRVLLTGHLGYIGTVLAPMLQQRGHEVVGLDTDLYRACTFGAAALPDVPNLAGDVRDIEPDRLRGFDAVLHLAGLSNDPLGDLNAALTMEINHRASVRLAELARAAGVRRYIFSSSCSNYGAGGNDWIDEQGAFNPVTPYGESKVATERGLLALAGDDFSPVLLRNATAFGYSPRIRFDLVVNNLTAWAVTTGQVMLKSAGTQWRPLVHIEDISRAFVATLEAPAEQVHCEAFNVGSTQENYRIREVAELVAEVIPTAEVSFAEGAGEDVRNYRVNCDKYTAAFPEFAAQWTVKRGIEQLAAEYRRTGLTLEAFEGPQFKRVAHIRQLLAEGVLDDTLRFRSTAAEALR